MRKLFSLFLALLSLSANARQISSEEAAAIASDFLNSETLQRAAGRVDVRRAQAKGSNQTEAPYYVFNAADNKGFAIVAGDDRVPRILGYSDRGTFDFANIPPQLAALLESYTKQIESLSGSATHPSWNKPARTPGEGVLLETANWGQGYPYNTMTPVVDGEHCPTGCVATAMAIVMKYHNWPESYNWDAIPMEATTPVESLSQLMRDAGDAVFMNYTSWESGANMNWVGHRLQSKFHYSPDCQFITAAHFSNEEWLSMLHNNLDKGNPVIYNGRKDFDNHAFIIDGYKEDTYHVNWGWDGQCNGYFALTALTPNEVQDYSENTAMVMNIVPDKSGAEYSENFVDYGYFWGIAGLAPGCHISTADVSGQKPFSFSCGSSTLFPGFKGEVGIALVDKDNNIKEVIHHQYFSTWSDIDECYIPTCYDFVFNRCVIQSEIDNTDKIQLVSKDISDKAWKLMLGTIEGQSFLPISGLQPSVAKVTFNCTPECKLEYFSDEEGEWVYDIESGFTNNFLRSSKITLGIESKPGETGMIVGTIKGIGVYGNEERFSGSNSVNYAFMTYGESYIVDIQFVKTGVEKTVHLSEPGTLSEKLSTEEALSISYLTITGKMNVLDFWYIRDNFSNIEKLDIADVEIVECVASDEKYTSFYEELPWTFAANSIPDWALTGLTNLSNIILPESITAIESNSMMNLDLERISIPAGVESIGLNVFFDNPRLMIIEARNPQAIFIKDCIFTNTQCPENGLLYVPVGSKDSYKNTAVWQDFKYIIEGEAPASIKAEVIVDGLKYCTYEGSNEASVIGYDGEPINLDIPGTIEANGKNYTVTHIEEDAFRDCISLESVSMSDNITSLGYNVFSGCSNLKHAKLSTSLKVVSSGAFYGTCQLEECTMGENIEVIGANAFFDSGLTYIYIPKSACYENSANCFGLNRRATEYIVHPDNPYFKSIDGVLYRIKDEEMLLEAVPCLYEGHLRIADGTTSIMQSALSSQVSSIYVPESVELIDNYAYESYYVAGNLRHITFAMRGTIKPYAFCCPDLESLTFEATPGLYESMFVNSNYSQLKYIFLKHSESIDLTSMFAELSASPTVYTQHNTPHMIFQHEGCVYVPGATAGIFAEVHDNVKEMWTYEIDKELGAVRIVPGCEGLEIDKVTINGIVVQQVNNLYNYAEASIETRREAAGDIDVIVDYTLHDLQSMTTHYDSEFNAALPSTKLTSNIMEIIPDSDGEVDVYGVDGTLLVRGCDREHLRQLVPGAYILRNGERVVKTIIR